MPTIQYQIYFIFFTLKTFFLCKMFEINYIIRVKWILHVALNNSILFHNLFNLPNFSWKKQKQIKSTASLNSNPIISKIHIKHMLSRVFKRNHWYPEKLICMRNIHITNHWIFFSKISFQNPKNNSTRTYFFNPKAVLK